MNETPRRSVSVVAVILDGPDRVLLGERRDNGQWERGSVLEMDRTIGATTVALSSHPSWSADEAKAVSRPPMTGLAEPLAELYAVSVPEVLRGDYPTIRIHDGVRFATFAAPLSEEGTE